MAKTPRNPANENEYELATQVVPIEHKRGEKAERKSEK